MRSIEKAGLSASQSSVAKLAPFEHFFARDSHRRHIPRKQAIRVPRQGWDPVAAFTWVVLTPAACILGWYGLVKLLLAVWRSI